MPNSEFLEKYPLYRKLRSNIPYSLNDIPKVNINMLCEGCKSNQTFILMNEYSEFRSYSNYNSAGQIITLKYRCAHCEMSYRYFILKIAKNRSYYEKIGQEPPWDISIERNIKKFLGKYERLYKNGIICESQGYGIGAYTYYRRVIEGIIDDLLNMLSTLLKGTDKENFEIALKKTKNSKIASEKIALVKELLPSSLKPEEFNPLKTLYEILSEGIHGKEDNECLEDSQIIREILIFLIDQISQSKKDQRIFTENMKRLLAKKANKEKIKKKPKQIKKVVKTKKDFNKEKKITQELFDYFIDLFNHFEEVEKPINNNEYKNNKNYLYFKYKLRKSEKEDYYDTDDLKHKTSEATDKLKKYLVILGYYNYSDVKELIRGYYLKLPVSGIKIEQNKISIHRSKEHLLEDPNNMKSSLKFFLDELESLANKKNLQLNNVFSIEEYENTFNIRLDDNSIAYMKKIFRLLKHKLSLNDFLEKTLFSFINNFQSNAIECDDLSHLNELLEYNSMRESISNTDGNSLTFTLNPYLSEKLHNISIFCGVIPQVIIEFGLKDELYYYNSSHESGEHEYLKLFIDK